VIRVLDRNVLERGYPRKILSDNEPEFISIVLADWSEEHGVILDFTEPGKPTQKSFIERFNRTYRTEVLDMYVFQ
jgi:putative transposase